MSYELYKPYLRASDFFKGPGVVKTGIPEEMAARN